MKPPNLGEARGALDCIVAEADRAGDIHRIRDHIKKAPPKMDRFDVNEAIRNAIILTRGVRSLRSAPRSSRNSPSPCLHFGFYTTKAEGMGMGLAICRSIVEAYGGRLWATACEPHGTLFQLKIPAEQDATS